jgi:hypothetical protein
MDGEVYMFFNCNDLEQKIIRNTVGYFGISGFKLFDIATRIAKTPDIGLSGIFAYWYSEYDRIPKENY